MKRYILLILITTTSLWGSSASHHGFDPLPLIAHIVNFIILVGSFLLFGKKPIKKMLVERRRQLKSEVESAQKSQENAARQLAFYEQKLASINEEISSIENSYLSAGESEASRLNKEHQEAIERLKKQSETQQNQAIEKMKYRLMMTLSNNVLKQTEINLKSDLKDQKRRNKIVQQFKIG